MATVTGHVEPYKRNGAAVRGRWRLVIDYGRDDLGKRQREVTRFDGGKKEADAELAALLTKARKGVTTAKPTAGTVGEWLDKWLEVYVAPKARDGEIAGRTHTFYAAKVRLYLKPEIGDVPLKKLTPELVMAMYEKMGRAKSEGGYGVSPRTREGAHVTLSMALQKAVELGLVRVNALEKGRGVDRPRVRHEHAVNALEEEDVLALMGRLASAQHELFLPAYLALVTGMRRGEILALAWEQVKLPGKDADDPGAGGTITVSRAWDDMKSEGRDPLKRHRLKPPKNGKERVVDIGPDVVAVLREHKRAQAAERVESSAWYTGADRPDGSHLEWGNLVITRPHGFPWWPDSFSSRWHVYCKEAGVVCRFHDLRGTSGSLALEAGIDPKTVQERLGHYDEAFFLRHYAKSMRRARERDAAIMNGVASRIPVQSGTKSGHQPGGEVVAIGGK